MLANLNIGLQRIKLLKSTIVNIGWLFFDRIFRVCSAMLVGVWIARYFGPDDYGTWSYAFLFPTTLAAVAGLGFNNTLVTLLVHRQDVEPYTLLGTSFALRLLSGSVCYGLIAIISYNIHQHEQAVQILILFTSVNLLFQGFDVIELFFQSKVQSKRSVWAKTFAFLVGAILKILLLLGHFPLRAFVMTVIVENAIGALLLVYFYKRYTQSTVFNWKISRFTANELLQISWPIMLSECMIYIYMRIDQFMIHHLTNSAELGRYTAALRISESWYFVAGAIVSSLYPSIVNLWRTNRKKFYWQYQRLLNRLIAFACLVALIISSSAPLVTNLLFGDRFTGVDSILAIHVWAGVFVFLGIGSNNLFILHNLQKTSLYRTALGVLVNVLLNLWLIPTYGAIGASIATLIAQIAASYLVNVITESTRLIFRMQTKAILNIIFFRFNKLF